MYNIMDQYDDQQKREIKVSIEGGEYGLGYEIRPSLSKMDLDYQAKIDIMTGRGFRITTSDGDTKDLYSPTSIFSSKFGDNQYSDNPFESRYKCSCGKLKGVKYSGSICKTCKTEVKFVDDDFGITGWLIMDNYKVIHPIIFEQIRAFIEGTKKRTGELDRILEPVVNKDIDGNIIAKNINEKEPFIGIGMIAFRERFVEIMNWYMYNKFKCRESKVELYNDIMESIDRVFTSSIPVYTIHLRPIAIQNKKMVYDPVTSLYTILAKNIIKDINRRTMSRRNNYMIDKVLYKIQVKLCEVTNHVLEDLKSKTGAIRSVFSGRYNFTARAVIRPRPGKIDEVSLPYCILSEVLQQTIINILCKSESISPNEAYIKWLKAKFSDKIPERKTIVKIISEIISNSGRGIPVLLNRNPSIGRGSIEQFYVVECTNDSTIGIPNQVLPGFAADYDGDTMNIMFTHSAAFRKAIEMIMNPRNSFYISNDDGYVDSGYIHNKDLVVNMNSLRELCVYTDEEIQNILKIGAN